MIQVGVLIQQSNTRNRTYRLFDGLDHLWATGI
jgi:hypothetical protein